MLDKKQIWAIFLFKFKMGCKAVETTHNINNAFGPGTANTCTVQWWFKKFCKGEPWRWGVQWPAIRSWQPPVESHHQKLILLQLHENLLKNSTLTILWSFGIWSKLEKWKSLINWCLMNWPQSKEIITFKCHLLLFHVTTMNHFSIRIVMCNKQCEVWWFLRQLMMTSSVTGLRRSSKVLPQAKLAPKKCHRSCLVVCCQFDPVQLSKSQWDHYIWEVCSANSWDTLKTAMPAAGIGQQKGPNYSPWQAWLHVPRPVLQELNKLGYVVLPHPPYSPDLLSSNISTTLQWKCFHYQQEAENAFQEFVESQSTDFYATGINKLISHWQKCADCNGSYFD